MIPNRIKIKFGGRPYLATAYDADTGAMIPNIKRVDLVAVDVNNSVYEARLVVDVDEIEGEIIAAATVPPTLSDAEIDVIARRIERQMGSRFERLTEIGQRRAEREQANI